MTFTFLYSLFALALKGFVAIMLMFWVLRQLDDKNRYDFRSNVYEKWLADDNSMPLAVYHAARLIAVALVVAANAASVLRSPTKATTTTTPSRSCNTSNDVDSWIVIRAIMYGSTLADNLDDDLVSNID